MFIIACKMNLKKKPQNKYWTLVNDSHTEMFKGSMNSAASL